MAGSKESDTVKINSDQEEPLVAVDPQMGGWITFIFIAGSSFCGVAASGGALSNFIVYLINEFHVGSVRAAQISNIISGCLNLAPVAGAFFSDAFFGSYPVVVFGSFATLLGMVILALTSTISWLRPPACITTSSYCMPGTPAQMAVLYSSMAFLVVGSGGTRFVMPMGADQFDRVDQREMFFKWIIVITYTSSIVGSTLIVYVEDSLSWRLGFWICAALMFASLVLLIAGSRYYRRAEAKGNPFSGLAMVVVAAVRKRKAPLSLAKIDGFFNGSGDESMLVVRPPSQSLRFLNRAALIGDGDILTDGSVSSPWRLCTVEQVENLKLLVRLLPLYTSGIFVSVPLAIQFSFSVLQALSMDRYLSPHLSLPPGSITVANLIAIAVFIPIFDFVILFTGLVPTALQRLGAGHILNIAGIAASAAVDRRRLQLIRAHGAAAREAAWIAPMSALWLVLPLAVGGAGAALHYPSQVSFFYEEFPVSLRNSATAMSAMIIAMGFYLSTAVVGILQRGTDWLPDNTNVARMDNVFWMLAAVGIINFGYFLLGAIGYRRVEHRVECGEDD